jgi:hypothetical protein
MELSLRPEVADKYNLSTSQKANEIGIAGIGTIVFSHLTIEKIEFLKNGEVDYLPMLTAKENTEIAEVVEKKKTTRPASPEHETAR